jgi:hypothetical protein
MSPNEFCIKTIILKSNHNYYQEKKQKKLNIINNIGNGSYGFVFMLDNNHVIKIFKNSKFSTTIFEESNYLIPLKNENRELIFYFKYKNQKKDHNYIVQLYSIGILNDSKINKYYDLEEDSYFIILPYCIPFYTKYNIWNESLINSVKGISFTLKVMKRLLEISDYLETKYGYLNLDLKLNNFMFVKDSNDLNDLIMIDFSILKSKIKNKKYIINRKYYIWPNGNNIILDNIPSYSVCINGLELLFGYNNLLDFPNEKKINNFLKIIQVKNKNLYNIFYNGIYLKMNTENLLKLINLLNQSFN